MSAAGRDDRPDDRGRSRMLSASAEALPVAPSRSPGSTALPLRSTHHTSPPMTTPARTTRAIVAEAMRCGMGDLGIGARAVVVVEALSTS